MSTKEKVPFDQQPTPWCEFARLHEQFVALEHKVQRLETQWHTMAVAEDVGPTKNAEYWKDKYQSIAGVQQEAIVEANLARREAVVNWEAALRNAHGWQTRAENAEARLKQMQVSKEDREWIQPPLCSRCAHDVVMDSSGVTMYGMRVRDFLDHAKKAVLHGCKPNELVSLLEDRIKTQNKSIHGLQDEIDRLCLLLAGKDK